MRVLIISDTHLTHHFESQKYSFLHRLILKSDRVIINGDFWDGWLTSFDQFLASKWSQLFPLLIQKQTVYIHGNHDSQPYCDHRISQFSIKDTNEYRTNIGGIKYIFTHGHLLLKNRRSPLINLYIKFIDAIEFTVAAKPVHHFTKVIDRCCFAILGHQGIANLGFVNESNRIMKANHPDPGQTWLVCGDSHLPEVDNRAHYANSGCILKGKASYLTIESTPKLHLTNY